MTELIDWLLGWLRPGEPLREVIKDSDYWDCVTEHDEDKQYIADNLDPEPKNEPPTREG